MKFVVVFFCPLAYAAIPFVGIAQTCLVIGEPSGLVIIVPSFSTTGVSSCESRAKPRLSYAESRRKWAKAKDGTMMTKPDGSPMTMTGLSVPVNREAA